MTSHLKDTPRWTSILAVLALLGFATLGCSAPPLCQGQASSLSIDTNGSPCTRHCECNNQRFEGHCVLQEGRETGVCQAVSRDICETKGSRRPCLLAAPTTTCREGIQVCQPDYLNTARWGDCQPIEQATNESTQAKCFDGIDNDCDGVVDEGCDPAIEQGELMGGSSCGQSGGRTYSLDIEDDCGNLGKVTISGEFRHQGDTRSRGGGH